MKVMHLIYSDTMCKTSTTIPTEWKEFMNIDAQKTTKKRGRPFTTKGYKLRIEINWNNPLEIKYSIPILYFAISA